ncbi:olfactory receptor 13C2-like [Carassius gibelio]|uniref:olfactory receptor 13C2-like n=1 Tax=Carassius gibelio TaxID=101364 RepID=UPI002277F0BD|nr:olfactory receptor 13C2-like [Carassius gibelio]
MNGGSVNELTMNLDFTENRNISIPSYFYITGLSGIPHMRYYYIFLFFVYFISLLGNSCLMFVIIMDRNLHTPKYISVFNLSLTDICESTAVIPQLLDTFLFGNQLIPYGLCLSNMFSNMLFFTEQSLTLTVLSFDRLVAISLPLRYHMIVTHGSMLVIIGASWTIAMLLTMIGAIFMSRLSFCKFIVTVNSFYCDHGPIYRSACNNNFPTCNDISINILMGHISFGLLICTPLILIIISYFCIALALLKIAHGADRIKAIKTCTSHLILVAIFYLPVLCNVLASVTTPLHPNAQIINNSLTQTIPPMLNPIIYTLKTEEVMQSIKELYKHSKVNTHNQKPEVVDIPMQSGPRVAQVGNGELMIQGNGMAVVEPERQRTEEEPKVWRNLKEPEGRDAAVGVES